MTAIAQKQRFPYAQALAVAEELRTYLRPACERIEIAGSLRRRMAYVGDVELLCIPKPWHAVSALDPPWADALVERVQGALASGRLAYRLNVKGSRVYGPRNKLLLDVASGIGVDIFSTTAENWGMALLVRTGPKEFNIRAMSRFRQLDMRGHAYGGVTDAEGLELVCPTEEEVFRLLGWGYVPPEGRDYL